MEKQAKPLSALGKKHQRKTSAGNPSELKRIKITPSASPTKLYAVKLSKSNIAKPKMVTKLETPESPTKVPEVKKPKGVKRIVDTQVINAEDSIVSQKSKPPKHVAKSDNSKPVSNDVEVTSPKKKKRKVKVTISDTKSTKIETLHVSEIKKEEDVLEKVNEKSEKSPKRKHTAPLTLETIAENYPVLKDKELIEKFMKIPLNNNQKGRIRLAIKSSLQGTSNTMFPEIINGKIQGILKSSQDLTDSELRRIRILYNMLKTALENPAELEPVEKPKKKKKKKDKDGEKGETEEDGDKKDKAVQKVKGPKRYVVFLGNLPLNINKEQIMDHFRELNEQIVSIRVPKVAEGKKTAIAYVELNNEPSYELALSKHHSMLGNRRIKVLYTTQQNSKISRSEAKSKSAKLIAMQKSGKLVGSTPQGKRRSHRRAILKQARAKEAAASA